MNLLFIHGRSQEHKDPVLLQQEWESALRDGFKAAALPPLQNVQVVFPFYGDLLDQLVQQINKPLLEDVAKSRGAGVDKRELEFKAALLMDMAKGYKIDDDIDDHYEGDVKEKGPLNWQWVHAILKTLSHTPMGETSIDKFTHDVYVYMTFPYIFNAINKMVSDKLSAGKWIVVAHSLGTIVGYNVLCKVVEQSNIVVKRYITVGSPLGIQTIREHLGPLCKPACVGDWYNAYDPRDVVALFPLDSANFNIQPPIVNYGKVNNFTDNRHGIAGYLSDPYVAKHLAEALIP
jgi:hypothetical protein